MKTKTQILLLKLMFSLTLAILLLAFSIAFLQLLESFVLWKNMLDYEFWLWEKVNRLWLIPVYALLVKTIFTSVNITKESKNEN